MELTGKCKKDFIDWSEDHDISDSSILAQWHKVPNSMKFGFYQEFFDSIKIRVIIDLDLEHLETNQDYMLYIEYEPNQFCHYGRFQTRKEAQLEAISEVNKIYNPKTE